jgi:hypothetical protein
MKGVVAIACIVCGAAGPAIADPGTADLQLEAHGASATLDGAPFSGGVIPAGRHRLTLSRWGRASRTFELDLGPGDAAYLDASLPIARSRDIGFVLLAATGALAILAVDQGFKAHEAQDRAQELLASAAQQPTNTFIEDSYRSALRERNSRRIASVALGTAALGTAAASVWQLVRGDDSGGVVRFAPGPRSQPTTSWYGWKIALADAAAVATLVIGFKLSERDRSEDNAEGDPSLPIIFGTLAVSAAGYLIAPAALHLAHDDRRHALIGTIVRIGLPLGLTAFGAMENRREEGTGFVAGLAAASLIDVVLLSSKRRAPRASLGVVKRTGGAELNLSGQF